MDCSVHRCSALDGEGGGKGLVGWKILMAVG